MLVSIFSPFQAVYRAYRDENYRTNIKYKCVSTLFMFLKAIIFLLPAFILETVELTLIITGGLGFIDFDSYDMDDDPVTLKMIENNIVAIHGA